MRPWNCAGFPDDHAAPGMTDEHGRAILSIENCVGGGDIVGQRGQRVLDGGHLIALGGKNSCDAVPAGLIDEGAMHQHNVLDGLRGRRLGEGRCDAQDGG